MKTNIYTKTLNQTLKTSWSRAVLLSTAAGGLLILSGCVIRPYGEVGFEAPVVTVAPAVEVEPVMVPETYAWDGVEFVGLVGDQYFYLGPNHVWLAAGPDRIAFFHGWEGGHPDWRNHATRNVSYRQDARGRTQPQRDDRRDDKRN
jgi:hypothetical protein